MHHNISRRAMLQRMGVAGAATFLPWLRPRRASAAVVPTRLLLFWAGSGVHRQSYTFASASGGAPTETDFVFPDVRAPLNEIKDQLTVFRNLDMVSATVDTTAATNAHYAGETHSLSAINRANGDTAGGPSIDQYIAAAINASGPVTKVPSLSLAAQTDGNVGSTKVCTAKSGQVVALEPSPKAVYQRLFSGFVSPMQMMMPTGPTPAQIAATQQKSVLDMVLGDFAALKPALSSAAKQKLDAHASAVRDFEQRLALGSNPASGITVACTDPGLAVVDGTGNMAPGDSTLLKRDHDAMTHLVQMAFACDLTRVVLLAPAEPFGDQWGYQSGAWGTSGSHDLIHKTSYNSAGTLKDNPDAIAAVTALHQLECQQFKAMLDLLRQVPEQDGSTMLDHTIVLWCSQIAEHGHDLDELPWILAGGAKAGFPPGRYLEYPRVGGKGTPHNNLFVSIAQAMGVSTDSFGNPSVCTGPLDNLRV